MKKTNFLILLLFFNLTFPVYPLIQELKFFTFVSAICFCTTYSTHIEGIDYEKIATQIKKTDKTKIYDFLINYYLSEKNGIQFIKYINENKDDEKLLMRQIEIIAEKYDRFAKACFESVRFFWSFAYGTTFFIILGTKLFHINKT